MEVDQSIKQDKNIDKSVIIVLIGTGPLENKLKKHINLKQITNLIIWED